LSFLSPTPLIRVPDVAITSQATTPDGALWVAYDEFDDIGGSPPGSSHHGLYRSQDGQVSHYELPGTIRVLAVAPDGSLHIGAGRGVIRIADGRLETLADVTQGQESFTRAFVPFDIAFTPDGDVWVGGIHSLARYNNKSWTQYDVNVRRLLVAPDGSLWGEGWDGVAGSGCCYVHVAGDRWVTYTHSAALPVSQELLGEIHRLID
jgi:ligand-binding sensor domain-containing protein